LFRHTLRLRDSGKREKAQAQKKQSSQNHTPITSRFKEMNEPHSSVVQDNVECCDQKCAAKTTIPDTGGTTLYTLCTAEGKVKRRNDATLALRIGRQTVD
jgi:hypothetical protein